VGPQGKAFLKLLLSSEVLRFGSFKTKSGRLSPYFFNTGNFKSGLVLSAVASIYADVIIEKIGAQVDNLFGPAYKGIPLAVMTAHELAKKTGKDVTFTFNRKEAKDHGEGGTLVGHAYTGREKVVVIEDVITGGTSFSETLPILKHYGIRPAGLIVGVDRQEKGNSGEGSAYSAIAKTWDTKAVSIVTIQAVIAELHNREFAGKVWIDDTVYKSAQDYLATYGAR
jgi:orotate phosphoribosyltransferase